MLSLSVSFYLLMGKGEEEERGGEERKEEKRGGRGRKRRGGERREEGRKEREKGRKVGGRKEWKETDNYKLVHFLVMFANMKCNASLIATLPAPRLSWLVLTCDTTVRSQPDQNFKGVA